MRHSEWKNRDRRPKQAKGAYTCRPIPIESPCRVSDFSAGACLEQSNKRYIGKIRKKT